MEEIVEKYLGLKNTNIKKIEIGSQNETYSVDDKYVIKIYNKDTIGNEYEREVREIKEQVAEIAAANGINLVLPYKFNGRYIQKKEKYFSIYPYVPYKAISRDEVVMEHIQEVARVVRTMHGIAFDVPLPNKLHQKFNIDFDKYIFIHKDKTNMRDLLMNNKAKLEALESRINRALDNLKGKVVISHNDLKLANVLWDNFNAYLVDWDAVGYINHMCAANEYAYFWATYKGELNKEYYKTFMKLYMAKHECNDSIYDVIYATLYGKFEWLKYSLERSTYSDSEDAKKGEDAVIGLVQEFNAYEKNIPEMVSIFNTLDDKFGE